MEKKKTKYQRALAASSNYCKTGTPAAKERRDKAIQTYKEDALKKGKTDKEVGETISRLKGCNMVGAKKRKTAKKTKK